MRSTRITQMERNRKRSRGFMYTGTCLALFLCETWIFVLLHREFVDLPIQLVFNLFLSWIPMIQHHTSLMQILVPTMEPFVGLVGHDPGSTLVKQTNPYTTGPFGISPGRVYRSLTRSNVGCYTTICHRPCYPSPAY